MKFSLLLLIGLLPFKALSLPVESWRCGAPLVEALRQSDPENLLRDPKGKLNLEESLEEISESNLERMRKRVGTLSQQENEILERIQKKFPVPIIHRTYMDSSYSILTGTVGIRSAAKRKTSPRVTPDIEQLLFSGNDCIYASVAPPYGIENYGTVIMRFKNQGGFSWGSVYTGHTWTLEKEKRSISQPATLGMKIRFAEQVFTNNHWDEALAMQLILNVREGTSIRGKGYSYNKKTILDELLKETHPDQFWKKINNLRLAFLEAHYIDDVPVSDFDFVQFRSADLSTVKSWGLPEAWFNDSPNFIQHFPRDR